MADLVVATEGVAIVAPQPGFSWVAVFAGALVASATILFLLFLGSGVGLSLFSAPNATASTAANGITLGAIYFFAAQAFGLVIGGYLAGRLMGPVLESEAEEIFHASSHGLAVWALGVIMTATMVATAGVTLSGAGLTAGATIAATTQTPGDSSSATGYWVDTLFRPSASGAVSGPQAANAAQLANIPADRRTEAGRILQVGLPIAGKLSAPDRGRLADLVSQYANVDKPTADERVGDVEMRIQQQASAAAETARKYARYVTLWFAASLIFGALVASAAAVSGRWIDDKARMQA